MQQLFYATNRRFYRMKRRYVSEARFPIIGIKLETSVLKNGNHRWMLLAKRLFFRYSAVSSNSVSGAILCNNYFMQQIGVSSDETAICIGSSSSDYWCKTRNPCSEERQSSLDASRKTASRNLRNADPISPYPGSNTPAKVLKPPCLEFIISFLHEFVGLMLLFFSPIFTFAHVPETGCPWNVLQRYYW